MKVIKGLFLLLFSTLILQSCQERMICPAYQSTFILDDEARYELFSRFEKDSVPEAYAGVNKNAYGLIKQRPRKKREREMATVAMRNVLPVKKNDSLTTSATDIRPMQRQIHQD